MSLLLAQSGHHAGEFQCPLLGVKRTLLGGAPMSAFDPKRHCPVRLHQSALAPENFTTLPHFSVSSAMSFPKSAGEPKNGVPPRSANLAFILGSARPALISLLSLLTISAGVAFGAPIPYQALAS